MAVRSDIFSKLLAWIIRITRFFFIVWICDLYELLVFFIRLILSKASNIKGAFGEREISMNIYIPTSCIENWNPLYQEKSFYCFPFFCEENVSRKISLLFSFFCEENV